MRPRLDILELEKEYGREGIAEIQKIAFDLKAKNQSEDYMKVVGERMNRSSHKRTTFYTPYEESKVSRNKQINHVLEQYGEQALEFYLQGDQIKNTY